MKKGQKFSEESKQLLRSVLKGKYKNIQMNITFTDKEKALIKQYCDERIKELLKVDMWGVQKEYAESKRKLKRKIEDATNTISTTMFEDLYDMVWNREYLDNRHSIINLTILKKIEDTKYFKNKFKTYTITQKRYKDSQKIKYLRKKNENIYRQAN